MQNPRLPDSLWAELDGKLWHATGKTGLAGIATDGQIKVSTADRYENSFCRCRGCVSLFDFGEGSTDQDDFMRANWFPWLGTENEGRCAIWLEIDRLRSAAQLMSPSVVLERVRRERFRGKFFCGVEACHRGPIPGNHIVGALFINPHNLSSFVRCEKALTFLPDELSSFSQTLPEPSPEHPLQRALRLRKQKRQDDSSG
jgi:hypothetical protein